MKRKRSESPPGVPAEYCPKFERHRTRRCLQSVASYHPVYMSQPHYSQRQTLDVSQFYSPYPQVTRSFYPNISHAIPGAHLSKIESPYPDINTHPEEPQPKRRIIKPPEPETIPYSSNDVILVVGECNLSFTRALISLIGLEEDDFDVTACAYEPHWDNPGFVPVIPDKIDLMDPYFPAVIAARRAMTKQTQIKQRAPLSNDKAPQCFIFNKIIFSFPRSGPKGNHQPQSRKLIEKYFQNAHNALTNDGELHIIFHQDRAGLDQYESWRIPTIVRRSQFYHAGESVFPLSKFQAYGYGSKCANGDHWKPWCGKLHVFKKRHMSPIPCWFCIDVASISFHSPFSDFSIAVRRVFELEGFVLTTINAQWVVMMNPMTEEQSFQEPPGFLSSVYPPVYQHKSERID